MKITQWQAIAFPVVIVALSLLVYSNILRNGFTYDDLREIVNNPGITGDLDFVDRLFSFIPWPGKIRPPGRSVPLLTFYVNYRIDGLNPFGFHLVNICLHASISLLIYAVGLQIFPGQRQLSFLVAALFACHPIHSDVVAAAVGRSELISSFCYLSALWIYLSKTRTEDASRPWSYWTTLPLFLIGALSKGTAWTLPFTVMAFDYYRCKIRSPSPPARYFPIFVERLKKFYLPYLLLLIATLAYAAMGLISREEMGANYLVFLPAGKRILAALGILARYLVLLIWPAHLSCDYSYAQLFYQTAAIQVLWTAGGILAFLAAAVLVGFSLRGKGYCFLAAFIFAVNYGGVSNFFFVIDVDMAERLLYMASWGFCLMLGFLLDGARRRIQSREKRQNPTVFLWLLIVAILSAYSWRTWTRNREWKSNFTLFSAAFRVCPMSCRVNYNLGLEYYDRGRIDEAIFHYRKAVRILPWNDVYHLNLGEAYVRKGEIDKAIEEFKEVARLAPERGGGYINLASVYLAKGFADQAIESLVIAREIEPGDWRVYYNLGNAYMAKRHLESAKLEYQRSLELHPDHWEAWNRMGAINLEMQNPEEAVRNFKQAIHYFPGCKEGYNNLGLACAELGQKEEAMRSFRKALEIDPGFMKARNNLTRLLNK